MRNVVRVRGEVRAKRVVEFVIIRVAIKLIWSPGIRPVIVPARIPKRMARM